MATTVAAGRAQHIQYVQIENRPINLSDLNNDSLNELGKIPDVFLTSIADNEVLVYDATIQRWRNASAPPADISVNVIGDLGNVSDATPPSFSYLYWDLGDQRWEPKRITYTDIFNRPTAISDLSKDVNVSYWDNDAGYLTESTLGNVEIGDIGDITVSNPQSGQLLIYRDGEWVNDFGPPANISFNSIGDLGDVTYTGASPIDNGTLTVEYMGTLQFDSPLTSGNLTQSVFIDYEFGIAMGEFRDTDGSGTGVFASRGRGITLRSDVNYVRLTGNPDILTNRPEIRFETADFAGDNPTGNYIGFKMPEGEISNVTYLLPNEDGDTGDILATDGFGRLAWVAQAATSGLGDLQDVDLSTIPPTQGSIIQYNEAANLWMAGTIDVPDIDSINDLGDVSTDGANQPEIGEALSWNGTQWVPMPSGSEIAWEITATSSSAYIFSGSGIDGFTNNPTLYVIRGQKYKFTKTTGQHPFQLQTTPGIGQSAYEDGIAGTVPLGIGIWTWEVPLDAPTTLYYQCTAHEAMQGTIHVLDESGSGGGAALTVQAKDGSGERQQGSPPRYPRCPSTPATALASQTWATERRLSS